MFAVAVASKPVPGVDASDVAPEIKDSPASAASAGGAAAAGGKPAAKEAAAQAAPVEDSNDALNARFTKLGDEYAALPQIKDRVKRTGWARLQPGYKIFCCGNSLGDLLIILTLFLILYTCVGLFWWGLLEFYLATQQDWAALYTFAGVLGAGWIVFGIVVSCGECAYARAMQESEEAVGEDAA